MHRVTLYVRLRCINIYQTNGVFSTHLIIVYTNQWRWVIHRCLNVFMCVGIVWQSFRRSAFKCVDRLLLRMTSNFWIFFCFVWVLCLNRCFGWSESAILRWGIHRWERKRMKLGWLTSVARLLMKSELLNLSLISFFSTVLHRQCSTGLPKAECTSMILLMIDPSRRWIFSCTSYDNFAFVDDSDSLEYQTPKSNQPFGILMKHLSGQRTIYLFKGELLTGFLQLRQLRLFTVRFQFRHSLSHAHIHKIPSVKQNNWSNTKNKMRIMFQLKHDH